MEKAMLVYLIFVLFFILPPSLPLILLYGFVIIPNEPYVKFCKDGGVQDE